MANNHHLFSGWLPFDSPEQSKWCERQLDTVDVWTAENQLHGDDPEDARETVRFLLGVDDVEYHSDPGFDYEVESDGLWAYSEEFGDTYKLSILVERFLAEFRPDGVFVLTTADTCSKPRVGEFGGGGMVVTAGGTKFFNTSDIAARYVREFQRFGAMPTAATLHPDHPRSQWIEAVVQGDTILGYVDWVMSYVDAIEEFDNTNQEDE